MPSRPAGRPCSPRLSSSRRAAGRLLRERARWTAPGNFRGRRVAEPSGPGSRSGCTPDSRPARRICAGHENRPHGGLPGGPAIRVLLDLQDRRRRHPAPARHRRPAQPGHRRPCRGPGRLLTNRVASRRHGDDAPRSHRDRAAVQRRHGGQPAPRLAPVGPRRSRRRCAVWGTARRMRTGPNQHFMRPSPATPLTPAPRARSAPTCAGSSSGTFCPKAVGNCSRPGSWGTPPAAPTSGPGSPPDGRSATRPATADTAPATTSPSPGRPAEPPSSSPSCPTAAPSAPPPTTP